MITEVHQDRRFYRLSTGRAAHYENIKPHNPAFVYTCRHGRRGLSDDGSLPVRSMRRAPGDKMMGMRS